MEEAELQPALFLMKLPTLHGKQAQCKTKSFAIKESKTQWFKKGDASRASSTILGKPSKHMISPNDNVKHRVPLDRRARSPPQDVGSVWQYVPASPGAMTSKDCTLMPGMGHVPRQNLHGKRPQDQQAQMKPVTKPCRKWQCQRLQITAATKRAT